jgi:amino acid transporter
MTEEPSILPIGGGRRVTSYRIPRPHAGIVPLSPGQFEATEYAEQRVGLRGRLLDAKDTVLGTSMSNARLTTERISKKVALAVFSSDALSSTAYASQEILLILVLAGSVSVKHSLPIALAIAFLLTVVVVSFRQVIRAYPKGGGAYNVAHENLGKWAGLVAGASLLIDYALTVAVSISAAVEALVSAAPGLHPYSVLLAVGMVGLIALGNLRGLRESGKAFAIPTYGFVGILGLTIVVGMVEVLVSNDPNLFRSGEPQRSVEPEHALTLFLLLRAFSAGCSALTGVEAIADGVSAFKPPEWRNAITTLTAMAFLLGFLFLGTTLLARHFGIVFEHGDKETVMAQVGKEVWGKNIVFYVLQFFTAGILFLAANTAYSGFPLLGAILARDSYLPRFFHQRGNRLVFSYGIATLTGGSVLLIVGFNAETTRLIALYALGVFLSFTLAQAGMVLLWWRRRDAGWKRSLLINGFGGSVTAAVFCIILLTKFTEGGWMVVVAIPMITLMLWSTGRFYSRLRRRLHVQPDHQFDLVPRGRSRSLVLVPVEEINLATVMALSAACDRSSNITAVHVNFDAEDDDALIRRWDSQFPKIPLVVIESPFRTVAEPLAVYVRERLKDSPGATVVMPVIQVRRFWQRPLVNQSLGRLRTLLRGRRNVEFVDQVFALG